MFKNINKNNKWDYALFSLHINDLTSVLNGFDKNKLKNPSFSLEERERERVKFRSSFDSQYERGSEA